MNILQNLLSNLCASVQMKARLFKLLRDPDTVHSNLNCLEAMSLIGPFSKMTSAHIVGLPCSYRKRHPDSSLLPVGTSRQWYMEHPEAAKLHRHGCKILLGRVWREWVQSKCPYLQAPGASFNQDSKSISALAMAQKLRLESAHRNWTAQCTDPVQYLSQCKPRLINDLASQHSANVRE